MIAFSSAIGQENWQNKINEQLALTDNVRVDELIASLKQLDNLYYWNLVTATPEHRKEIITTVLHEFVLYPDTVELRYKAPVTELQVAELLPGSRRLPEN